MNTKECKTGGENRPSNGNKMAIKKCMLIFIMISTLMSPVVSRKPASVRIGSVFLESNRDRLVHEGFRQILAAANVQGKINDFGLNGTRIDFDTQYAEKNNLYDAYQKVCIEMQYKVIAIFGSSSPVIDSSVSSVCSSLHIPHLTTTMQTFEMEMKNQVSDHSSYSIYLGPSQHDLVTMIADVVKRLEWQSLALITHRETASLDTQLLLELLQTPHTNERRRRIEILDLKHTDSRPDLVKLRNAGFQNFIVDIGADLLNIFFDQATKSGIVHEDSSFVSSSLDFTRVDMDDLKLTGANIYGLSIINSEEIEFRQRTGKISPDMSSILRESYRASLLYDGVLVFSQALKNIFETQDMVIPDVDCRDSEASYKQGKEILDEIEKVDLEGITRQIRFKRGVRESIKADVLKLLPSGDLAPIGYWSKSEDGVFSKQGYLILNNFPSNFDRKDRKKQDLIAENKIGTGKILIVETIENNFPFVISKHGKKKSKAPQNLFGQSYNKRSDILSEKFTSTTPSWDLATENIESEIFSESDLYEGFLIDILNRLATDLNFKYVIRSNSKSYGSLDSRSGNWSGIIGQLVSRKADIGLADFTITNQRSKVLDYSPTIGASELTLVVQKQKNSKSDDSESKDDNGITMFSFLTPFSSSMWLSIVVAYVMVSLMMFFVSRISPYERYRIGNPYQVCSDGNLKTVHEAPSDGSIGDSVEKCGQLAINSDSNMGFLNSFWFTLTGFFLQSTSINPKSISTRFLTTFWWIFCLVILFLYFISLRATLFPATSFENQNNNEQTTDNGHQSSEDDRELIDFLTNPNTRLGIDHDSAILQTLESPSVKMYERIQNKMKENSNDESYHQRSKIEGLEEVRNNENFGFIIEGGNDKGIFLNGCSNVKPIGDILGSNYYAIAFPKGSPYHEVISQQLLRYNDDGSLYQLKRKWARLRTDQTKNNFCSRGNQIKREKYEKVVDSRTVPFHGPFLLLLVASIGSILIAILETLHYTYKTSKKYKNQINGSGGARYYDLRQRSFCELIKEEIRAALGCSPNMSGRPKQFHSSMSTNSTPRIYASNGLGGGSCTPASTNGGGTSTTNATASPGTYRYNNGNGLGSSGYKGNTSSNRQFAGDIRNGLASSVNGRNNGGLSPAMIPKSPATQALLLGRGEYPQEGFGRNDAEENDDEEENLAVGKKLFVKPINYSRKHSNESNC